MERQFLGGKGRPLWSIDSVCRELCKNGWTDMRCRLDAESGGPKEPGIKWGFRSPHGKGLFWGGRTCPTCLMTLWRELCKNGWTDRDTIWVMDSGGPKETCIRWGCRSTCKGAILRVNDVAGHAQWHSAMSCAQMAEPIKMPSGLWAQGTMCWM